MKTLKAGCLFFFLTIFHFGYAQTPVNDDCSGAIVISTSPFEMNCTSPYAASTVNATASPSSPSCATVAAGDDIWYQFTSNTSSVIISVENAVHVPSGFAIIGFEVYEGSCASLNSIICYSNTGGSNGKRIIHGLIPGNIYYVRFWTLSTTLAATFNFCIQDVPSPPSNDECTNAIAITPGSYAGTCTTAIHVNTTGSTNSTVNIGCTNSSDDDVWFSFTPTSSSVMMRYSNATYFTANGNASVGFALYESICPASGTELECISNFGGNGLGSRILSGLVPGTTYYLRLFSFGEHNYISFDFCLQYLPPTPDNDECINATPVILTSFDATCNSTVNANTYGATKSTPAPSCTGTLHDDDIWYRFTPANEAVLLRLSNAIKHSNGGPTQIGFALYDECPLTTTTIDCNNLITAGAGYKIITGLTPGHEYFLRFWDINTLDYASFEFCIQDIAQPPNDDCFNAIAVNTMPVGSVCNSGTFANTTGSTPSSNPSDCVTGFDDDDIWYSFTANTSAIRINYSNSIVTTSPSGSANLGYVVYNSACPTDHSAMSCNANIGNGNGSSLLGGLVPGNTYYLRFFTYGTNSFGSFDFCLVDVDLPLNDECINAITVPVSNGFCTQPVAGNLENATASPGFSAPVCAGLLGSEDVWFRVVVPASGELVIQTSAVISSINNLVMEAYEGNCGSLNYISCDSDGNPDPGPSSLHPRITLSGRMPSEIIFLRILGAGSINYGPFAICAWDPTFQPPVSPGGNCMQANDVNVDLLQSNVYMWVPIFDTDGNIVAEIFPNGNNLGLTNTSVFVNTSGNVRNSNGYYLDRNITITSSNNGSARVRIYIKNDELNALIAADPLINSINNLVVTKTDAVCHSEYEGPATSVITPVYGSYGVDYYAEFDASGFSSFFLNGATTVLPLKFISFTGALDNSKVVLKWKVVKDEEVKDFEIEYSSDGTQFNPIYNIGKDEFYMEGGEAWEYRFTDPVKRSIPGYFRIKMNGITGKYVYSAIIKVNHDENTFKIYPNPASDVLFVSGNPGDKIELTFANANGQEVRKIEKYFLSSRLKVDIQNLSGGLYILRIRNKKDGKEQIFRLIKD